MSHEFRRRLGESIRVYKADRRNSPLTIEFHFHQGDPQKVKIIEERRSGTLRILTEFETKIDGACLTQLGSLM